jgi:hypothetical protein
MKFGGYIASEKSMKIFSRLTVIAILLSPLIAAGEGRKSCERYAEIFHSHWPGYKIEQCDCSGNGVQKYKVHAWPGMRLVAACDVRNEAGGDLRGGFYFAGKSEISANVEYQEYPSGDTIFLGGARFIDEASAKNFLKLPSLSTPSACWTKAATIEVTHALNMLGDSDESGLWILKFRVKNRGRSRGCTPIS